MTTLVKKNDDESVETLIERARKFEVKRKSKKDINEEDIEVAKEWIKDKISFNQIVGAYNSTNALNRVARSLKVLYQKGELIIIEVGESDGR
jgi:selenocysteine lyase/cysteine desulfurase